MSVTPEDILQFWFEETEQKAWYTKDDAFDALLRTRFEDVCVAASQCELSNWRNGADGRLAEILLLDQFSRNIFRHDRRAFASDPLALGLAQEMVRAKLHDALPPTKRTFVLMPYMHSESKAVHRDAVRLFEELGNPSVLDYEHRHKEIIDRFERYPHRNKLLGRTSTAEELAFLDGPGSSF